MHTQCSWHQRRLIPRAPFYGALLVGCAKCQLSQPLPFYKNDLPFDLRPLIYPNFTLIWASLNGRENVKHPDEIGPPRKQVTAWH